MLTGQTAVPYSSGTPSMPASATQAPIAAGVFGGSKETELAESLAQKTQDEQRKAEIAKKDIENAMLSNISKYNEAYAATMKEIMTGKKPAAKKPEGE